MSNEMGAYNPKMYANEALIQLEKQLGMASRVHLGYNEERRAFRKGNTIDIRRPGTFTAQNAPSTSQDVNTETVTMTLSNYRDVKFAVPDNEYAFTGERFINDHIRPAAVALANDIDLKLNQLVRRIPHIHTVGASAFAMSDLGTAQQLMFDLNVPEDEAMTYFEVNGKARNELSILPEIAQWQGSGQDGVEVQRRGNLGMKHGANFFANQQTQTYTSGTTTDTAGAINSASVAVGDSTVAVDALGTGTITAGTSFTVAGDSQKYVVTTGGTIAGNALTITFEPTAKVAWADNAVVTFDNGVGASTAQTENCRFHRNAFALVMAPLPDYREWFAAGGEGGDGKGGRIATIQDPITGLTLRARIWLEHDSAEIKVALDCLYAVQVLDHNLALRVLRNAS